MSLMRSVAVSLALILYVATGVAAEDLYLTHAASGGDTGADCANAHAASWFNASGNWGAGAGKISAGDTVHLCGTFSASVGGTVLTTQGSGTAGLPVTVLFETGAVLTSGAFGSGVSGAINCSSNDYITVNGGSNGTIVNTANGTNLTNHQSSLGIYFNNCAHATIQNLTINTIYVHAQDSNDIAGDTTQCVNVSGGGNVLVTHITCTDAATSIGIGGAGGTTTTSTAEVSFNTLSNCNRCIVVGVSTETYSGVLVHDNEFSGGAYLWDSPDNSHHHNAVHAFNTTSGHVNGLQLYNNYAHGQWGATSQHTTSMFFLETLASTTTIYIFNNRFVAFNNSNSFPTNGFMFCKIATGDCDIYNNVVVGINNGTHFGTAVGCNSPQVVNAENNIIEFMTAYDSVCTWTTVNYNDYNDVDAWAGSSTFTAWQGRGFDANGKNTDPLLDGNLRPTAGSPVISAGADLTVVGIGALDSDASGTIRPNGSAWDIGAYQYTIAPVGGVLLPRILRRDPNLRILESR